MKNSKINFPIETFISKRHTKIVFTSETEAKISYILTRSRNWKYWKKDPDSDQWISDSKEIRTDLNVHLDIAKAESARQIKEQKKKDTLFDKVWGKDS